jgi:hypothetical protein|tara:strand:+ start:19535 stop:19924 length:390 start_codon:yes stop_codon:yes gene_type:complete
MDRQQLAKTSHTSHKVWRHLAGATQPSLPNALHPPPKNRADTPSKVASPDESLACDACRCNLGGQSTARRELGWERSGFREREAWSEHQVWRLEDAGYAASLSLVLREVGVSCGLRHGLQLRRVMSLLP